MPTGQWILVVEYFWEGVVQGIKAEAPTIVTKLFWVDGMNPTVPYSVI